jgi:tellurite resistance protein TehA-like permease
MHFDVRLPIGLLFLAIGLLVAVVGLIGDKAVLEAHSAGVNIDLVWGLIMAGFGALMLILAALARRKGEEPPL